MYEEKIDNLKDARHFSLSQKKKIQEMTFSKDMFPAKNKALRRTMQNHFAEDVRQRCSAEVSGAVFVCGYLQEKGDIVNKVSTMLNRSVECIVSCYKGSCVDCNENSFICNPAEGKPWPKHTLPPVIKTGMVMDITDERKLRQVLRLRLSRAAVKKTYLNSTTQKVEAFNRLLSKTNPKNITSAKNFEGRVYAAVLHNNCGFETATQKLHSSIGHQVSANIGEKIKAIDMHKQQIKKNLSSAKSKTARCLRRSKKYQLYHEKKGQEFTFNQKLLLQDEEDQDDEEDTQDSADAEGCSTTYYQSGMDIEMTSSDSD